MSDPEETEAGRRLQHSLAIELPQFCRDSLPAGELSAFHFQGLLQPQFVKNRGMEPVRNSMDVIAQPPKAIHQGTLGIPFGGIRQGPLQKYASMASRATRWLRSSCNSRARRRRSSSCAVREFPVRAANLFFSHSATRPIQEKPAYEQGLQSHCSKNRQEVKAVLLPWLGHSEQNPTSWRKELFCNSQRSSSRKS